MTNSNDPQSQGQTGNDQFESDNVGPAAGTKRQPYHNDTGDPSAEEPETADVNAPAGQKNQPGLPRPDEESWSPGSDAEVP